MPPPGERRVMWGSASFFLVATEGDEEIAKVRANGDSPHPEKKLYAGSSRPCNSLHSLKGRPSVDKLVLNASTR